jgi:5'-nucleotidase
LDYGPAARVARKFTAKLLALGFPSEIVFNINVPHLEDAQIKGVQITCQGLRVYRDQLVRREDPRGKPYYWIGGLAPTGIPNKGTDFGALKAGYVSITPLQLDLTASKEIEGLRDVLENFSS